MRILTYVQKYRTSFEKLCYTGCKSILTHFIVSFCLQGLWTMSSPLLCQSQSGLYWHRLSARKRNQTPHSRLNKTTCVLRDAPQPHPRLHQGQELIISQDGQRFQHMGSPILPRRHHGVERGRRWKQRYR